MARGTWIFATLVVVFSLSCVSSNPGNETLHWSECSVKCGEGIVSLDVCDDKKCFKINELCNPGPCYMPGAPRSRAKMWSRWSECSVSCGGGTQQRTDPSQGTETRSCNVQSCSSVVKDCPADVVLVIDKSGSLWNSFDEVREFARAIVSGFPDVSDTETRVGIVYFDSSPTVMVEIPDHNSKSALIQDIDNIPGPSGGTDLLEAIEKMHELFLGDARFVNKKAHPDVRFVGIIVTDGISYATPGMLTEAAKKVHDDGIYTISIGVGNVKEDEIKAMASTLQDAHILKSVDQLNALTDNIILHTCTDECFRCNYTQGQLWLQYRTNCHLYTVCEPDGHGGYIKHTMTCGDLYWNQERHTCTRTKTGLCNDGPSVPYTGPPPVDGPCPYKAVPGNPKHFFSIDNPSLEKYCKTGLVFSEAECTCIVVGQIIPTCADDLLLHYDFETDFVDITCHHAVADQYGDGSVTLVSEPGRPGKVALFDGLAHLEVPFLRMWFAQNYVDAFSVSLYYKRRGGSDAVFGALVNNGDCIDKPGFSLRAKESNVLLSMIDTTSISPLSVTGSIPPSTANGWHHVVWVYNGASLRVFVDGTMVSSSPSPVAGFLVNNDVPMYVGFDCDQFFFDGWMDDLKIYSRAIM